MNMKDYALSIMLNLFLGYLWIIFTDHIVSIANSMNNSFVVGGLIILAGTFLFWEIAGRIRPFHDYKITHPVKLAGFASFAAVIAVHLFVVNLV